MKKKREKKSKKNTKKEVIKSNKFNITDKILIILIFFSLIIASTILLYNKDPIIKFTGFIIDSFAGPTSATITANFSDEIGIVRQDFYGANTHGFLTSSIKVDTDGDGVSESNSDLNWHKQAWLDSGMKYMRWDMGLGGYYFYNALNNLDFENWTDTNIGFFNSTKESGAAGWKVSTYGGGTGFASQSDDAYSGNYSLNVSCNKASHVYVYRNLGLKQGYNYNFSALVKPTGTISISIQRLDNYQSCGWASVTGNGTEWKFVSVYCNNSDNLGYRLVIDSISENESILIDEVDLTENSQEYSPDYYFTGNLSYIKDKIKWAHENNIRTLIIADYMPSWLADLKGEGCNQTKLTDCMPYDISIWKNITLDYLDRVIGNEVYVSDVDLEIWNEPYGGFFLSELPYDSPIKSVYYNQLYNATYNAIKSKYPNMAVGGPSGYYNAPNIIREFLSNFSQQMDFVSVHPYIDKYESNTNGMYNKTKWLFDLCKLYNTNCSRVINSEWNVGNSLIKNSSEKVDKYGTNIALAYSDILNIYPANISMLLYQWSEAKKYLSTTNYPEYPQKWNMVSESALDNEFTPAYNVTKSFATYHSGGSMIVRSNSSLSSVKVVASKKNNSEYITVINTGNESNVSIKIYNLDIEALKDLETGEIYNIENGIANTGLIQQYQIKHFVDSNYIAPSSTSSSSSSSPFSGSGGVGNVIKKENPEDDALSTTTQEESNEPNVYENPESIPKRDNTKEEKTGKVRGVGLAILGESISKAGIEWILLIVFLVLGIVVAIIYIRKSYLNYRIRISFKYP